MECFLNFTIIFNDYLCISHHKSLSHSLPCSLGLPFTLVATHPSFPSPPKKKKKSNLCCLYIHQGTVKFSVPSPLKKTNNIESFPTALQQGAVNDEELHFLTAFCLGCSFGDAEGCALAGN